MEQDVRMPAEYIHRIYIDERVRNAIAHAHICCKGNGIFSHYCAMTPDGRFIVTEEDINLAKDHLTRCKAEVFSKHKNNLLFVSMGMSYKPRYEDDPCNHRIRTEFLNKNRRRFFIEIIANGPDGMYFDYSIDRDLEIEEQAKKAQLYEQYKNMDMRDPKYYEYKKRYLDCSNANACYNYGGLERAKLGLKYTKQNILHLINDTYDCLFKYILIDENTISMNDREIICYSPTSIVESPSKQILQLELF